MKRRTLPRRLAAATTALLLLLAAAHPAAGQEPFRPNPIPEEPEIYEDLGDPLAYIQPGGIGVVMSGGGAKGLYHIGVLEALEENNVPIDYVAGTSMGAIVAAMYASGYSPAAMRQIVRSGAIQEWVSGRIDPNRYLSYYRQYGQAPTFINVRLDLRKGSRTFQLPTNILSSTQIDMAFTELFTPASVAAEGDFNRLMVPFLCVASDMNTRRPIIFQQGELAEAVRSSMSIPLLFKPMDIDSMILYDGGIYDNFPWKPLDAFFQPELIIGSICTSGNTLPSEENTVLDQAFLLAMQDTDYTLPEGRSVTIARAVKINLLDFEKAEETMDAGYADAMARMPEILSRISRRMTPGELEARRQAFYKRCPPLIFEQYDIEGVTPAQRAYIRDFMRLDRPDGSERILDFDQLRTNLYEVLAEGDLTMDFPQVTYDPASGCYRFAARFQTKPNFRLSVGGSISSSAFNMAHVGLNYRSIGRIAQNWGADFFLGPTYSWGTIGGRTDFYAGTPLFLDYAFNFQVRNLEHGNFGNLSGVDNALHIRENDIHGSVGFGMPVTHRSLFLVRSNFGRQNYHYAADGANSEATDHTRFSFFGVQAVLERNTLDRMAHAVTGSKLHLSGIYITGTDKLERSDRKGFLAGTRRQWFGARFTWDKFFDLPRFDWFSLGLNFDAVITNHPAFTRNGATLLTMPAYTPTQHSQMIYVPTLRGKRFVAGGVMPTFHLTPNCFIRTGFFAMYRERRENDLNFVGYTGENRPVHYLADLSAVYHTPIGPISLTFTKYDLNNWKNLYLVLSFGYAMFAPKGTFY